MPSLLRVDVLVHLCTSSSRKSSHVAWLAQSNSQWLRVYTKLTRPYIVMTVRLHHRVCHSGKHVVVHLNMFGHLLRPPTVSPDSISVPQLLVHTAESSAKWEAIVHSRQASGTPQGSRPATAPGLSPYTARIGQHWCADTDRSVTVHSRTEETRCPRSPSRLGCSHLSGNAGTCRHSPMDEYPNTCADNDS